MKRKNINQVFNAFKIFLFVAAFISILCLIIWVFRPMPKYKAEVEESLQKAEIENYHQSQGRDIKFAEDIIGY